MPDKTLAEKRDAVKGGKMAKERLTVLLCCNTSGEKLKPLVIGKARKPSAFSGVNVSRLPVTWRSSNKAWMNTAIFTEWLEQINRKMRQQKRNILFCLWTMLAVMVAVTLWLYQMSLLNFFQPILLSTCSHSMEELFKHSS